MSNQGHEKKPVRALGFEFSSGKYEEVDGGLLIRNVKLLGSGTWTDSHVKTPLHYPAKTLERFATNWRGDSLMVRHSSETPFNITDKIGEIRHPRYNDNAVVGDLFLHGQNQNSKDTISMVRGKQANWVSVEHYGEETYNPAEKRLEAQSLTFLRAAIVEKGACKVCSLDGSRTNSDISQSSAKEANENMETEEIEKLKTQLSEAESKHKELSEASEAKDATIRELESKLKESQESIRELSEFKVESEKRYLSLSEQVKTTAEELSTRLKKLESAPNPQTLVGSLDITPKKSPLEDFIIDSEGMTRRQY